MDTTWFGGIIVGDLLQLQPVNGSPVFETKVSCHLIHLRTLSNIINFIFYFHFLILRHLSALSGRTMRRDIAASAVVGNVTIFNSCLILADCVGQCCQVRWWIKADGVDVVKGLCESTRSWWGDVDLNDGKLQQLQLEMAMRLGFISQIRLFKQTLKPFWNLLRLTVNFIIEVSIKFYNIFIPL